MSVLLFAAALIAAILSVIAWLYLLLAHGRFWRADQRLPAAVAELPGGADWPAVTAVVPARNEADVIARCVIGLLRQDYPGPLRVVLVDDHSTDGTAEAARRAAETCGAVERLQIVAAHDLAPGWTGKLWALSQGLAAVDERADKDGDAPRYLWFSDADIEQQAPSLRRLVAKAETERLDLVSLMVMLSCRSNWDRLLIPAFVYFFQQLYPFAWVNDRKRRIAAAAGGCVLLRRDALQAAGGLAPIRDRIIDDCALGAMIKGLPATPERPGGIWLGLTRAAHSIRPYQGLGEIWRMVARSAYTQLRHSPLLLLGTLLGMALLYLVPPTALLAGLTGGGILLALAGGLGWLLMAVSLWPTLKLYELSPWPAVLLPVTACLYGAMTFDSALKHWRGRGGTWKGRAQAHLSDSQDLG